MIALSDIAKRFPNGVQALNDLSFTFGRGEFVSLLGPSGCGKSTALRLAAGLLTPDAGTVTCADGKPQIGFVFQDHTLMPWADALTNARLPLDLKRTPRDQADARASAALARVGLAGFEHAYPRELSGGMKMRVSIARALVTQPKLLLMDEPFAALDEITRTKLSNDLLDIWRKAQCTVMFVTHSVFESVYLSTRIVVMAARPGRIVGELPIDEPYPRDPSFRMTPRYSAHCREVSSLLDKAMNS